MRDVERRRRVGAESDDRARATDARVEHPHLKRAFGRTGSACSCDPSVGRHGLSRITSIASVGTLGVAESVWSRIRGVPRPTMYLFRDEVLVPVRDPEIPRGRTRQSAGRRRHRVSNAWSFLQYIFDRCRYRPTGVLLRSPALCSRAVGVGNQCRTQVPQPARLGGIEPRELPDPLEPVVHGVDVHVQ